MSDELIGAKAEVLEYIPPDPNTLEDAKAVTALFTKREIVIRTEYLDGQTGDLVMDQTVYLSREGMDKLVDTYLAWREGPHEQKD